MICSCYLCMSSRFSLEHHVVEMKLSTKVVCRMNVGHSCGGFAQVIC